MVERACFWGKIAAVRQDSTIDPGRGRPVIQTRRVLFFAPLDHTFEQMCAALGNGTSGGRGRVRRSVWRRDDLELRLDLVTSVRAACERLAVGYYNLVVVDCRNVPHPGASPDRQERGYARLLEALRSERDRERRYPRGRIVVLAGDADAGRVDRLLFESGQRHVGACLRDGSLAETCPEAEREAARRRFVDRFFDTARRLLVERRTGRKAICLAGGGFSGMYYELGVLKCLDDATDTDIRSFDLFFGISAGAVVTSCLANGMALDDVIAKVGEMDEDFRHRVRIGWRHLNVAEVPRRIRIAQQELARTALGVLRGRDELSVGSLLSSGAAVLGPFFDGRQFARILADLFSEPASTNDFRELPCELYVGATDQDSREHVLFGSLGWDHVPISVAVQASTAMHPFFASVEIDGRRYTDGIVTRTSNLGEALRRGADLVFVVDPFVPYIADEAGVNARHGNMWVLEQDYKTMSFTRFEMARNELLRQYPQVNVYTFLPSNRTRRPMTEQNPFAARNFHQIVCDAYSSTYRRLQALEHKIGGELNTHGIALDLAPVREKIEVLEDLRRPDVRVLLDEEPAGVVVA